jgi:hypothetical protein
MPWAAAFCCSYLSREFYKYIFILKNAHAHACESMWLAPAFSFGSFELKLLTALRNDDAHPDKIIINHQSESSSSTKYDSLWYCQTTCWLFPSLPPYLLPLKSKTHKNWYLWCKRRLVPQSLPFPSLLLLLWEMRICKILQLTCPLYN